MRIRFGFGILVWSREGRKVGRVVREVGRKWWKVREGRVSF